MKLFIKIFRNYKKSSEQFKLAEQKRYNQLEHKIKNKTRKILNDRGTTQTE